jgi:mannosyltransferase
MKLRYWSTTPALLVLLLAFGLRLYRLDFQSIWWDEGHSIFVAAHPIPQIPTLPAMDVHPPAYFALLHAWMAVAGTREFALRYLSVVFSLLTVALIWRFARSIQKSSLFSCLSFPILAALFAAISPLYVTYAQEVRSYAMITFLALASTYLMWRILFWPAGPAAGDRRSTVTLYILATAACLYTHYFTIFLLLFQNLVWLAWVLFPPEAASESTLGRRLVRWITTQAAILLLFGPQLWLALRQITGYTNPNLAPPSLLYFISQSWQAYTVGLTIDPYLAHWGMAAVAGVLFIAWLIQASLGHPKLLRHFIFLTTWLLLPLAAYYLVLQHQPSFEPRYMMLVTPALFLLLALGLGQATNLRGAEAQGCRGAGGQGGRGAEARSSQLRPFASRFPLPAPRSPLSALRSSLPALALIPLLVFMMGLYSYYTDETYFKDDSAGVAAWLAAETTSNDIIYVDVPHPFHYYVAQGHIPAPMRYLFVDIHTAAGILTRETAGRNRLFWVTWRGSDTDPRGVIPFLAEKYGHQLGQLDFRGYRVTWFSLPQGKTTFEIPATLSPSQATFGDVLRLDGLAYGEGPVSSDTTAKAESIWATLHFTLLRDTGVDYRVSLRLRDEAGGIVAQLDKDLLNDRHFRTSAWPVNDPALDQAINVYTLPLAPDTPPGTYRLEAVVYNAQPPYPAEGVAGHPSSDGVAAIIGTLTLTP